MKNFFVPNFLGTRKKSNVLASASYLQAGATFLLVPVQLKIFGLEAYGAWAQILLIITLVNGLSNFGIYETVAYLKNTNQKTNGMMNMNHYPLIRLIIYLANCLLTFALLELISIEGIDFIEKLIILIISQLSIASLEKRYEFMSSNEWLVISFDKILSTSTRYFSTLFVVLFVSPTLTALILANFLTPLSSYLLFRIKKRKLVKEEMSGKYRHKSTLRTAINFNFSYLLGTFVSRIDLIVLMFWSTTSNYAIYFSLVLIMEGVSLYHSNLRDFSKFDLLSKSSESFSNLMKRDYFVSFSLAFLTLATSFIWFNFYPEYGKNEVLVLGILILSFLIGMKTSIQSTYLVGADKLHLRNLAHVFSILTFTGLAVVFKTELSLILLALFRLISTLVTVVTIRVILNRIVFREVEI